MCVKAAQQKEIRWKIIDGLLSRIPVHDSAQIGKFPEPFFPDRSGMPIQFWLSAQYGAFLGRSPRRLGGRAGRLPA
jgi:hypothetical protein